MTYLNIACTTYTSSKRELLHQLTALTYSCNGPNGAHRSRRHVTSEEEEEQWAVVGTKVTWSAKRSIYQWAVVGAKWPPSCIMWRRRKLASLSARNDCVTEQNTVAHILKHTNDQFAVYLRHICDILATYLWHICDTFATYLQHICEILTTHLWHTCDILATFSYDLFGTYIRHTCNIYISDILMKYLWHTYEMLATY